MFPTDAVVVAEILLDFLELRENVGIVGPVDVAGQEDVAHGDEFLGKRRAGFDERRVEALEDVGVRFEAEADELFEFPVALFVVGFELLGDAGESPVDVGGREVEAAAVNVGALVIQSVGSGADDAAVDNEAVECLVVWCSGDFGVGVAEDLEVGTAVSRLGAIGEADAVGVVGRCGGVVHDADFVVGSGQDFGA